MKVTESSKYIYSSKNSSKNDAPKSHRKMRALLIIICIINILLYYSAYSYFDNILAALAKYELPVGFLTFIKYFIVFVLGFLIGLLVILGMKLKVSMNYFDIKVLLLAGSIPALALLLSYSGLANLLVNTFFSGNETAGELYYYFFSRTDIWALWLGVATGASVRLKLMQPQKKYRHQAMD